ncbi:hypothetical protein KR52_11390 [Synechococcus sp. KORDI-52]|nr:hypothetical protein KR52_11390 [Synechococcus sp. KORDI-52]
MKKHVVGLGLLIGAVIPVAAPFAPPLIMSTGALHTSPAHAATPLPAPLQGKPVVVEIVASWCSACQTIKPVMQTLRQQEGDAVHWVRFDVTNPASTQQAADRAEHLGLGPLFKRHRSQTSQVSVINPETGQAVKTFRAQPNLDSYLKAIATTRSMIGS